MLKTIGRVLITMIVLTLAVILGVFFYTHNRTYENKEEEVGNTTGNIYNGGLFCEQDGIIYFSNNGAGGSLYRMTSECTNIKPLRNDKAVYINADENYIYYVSANSISENNKDEFMTFYNSGVYRVSQNGKNLKAITGNPGAYLTLKGNSIYFQRYDAGLGLFLYRYQIDGTKEHRLIQDAVIPAEVTDNSLYYAGYSEDHNINSLDLSSFTTHPIINGSYLYPIYLGDFIYYMDPSDHYKIYRMNKDGSEPTKLVNYRTSTYNISSSGSYLFYQIDDAKHNGLHRMDLETMEDVLVKKGDYKNINITDKFVFFRDYDEKHTYRISIAGTSKPEEFTGIEEEEKK